MNNLIASLRNAFLLIWELPQNVLGALLYAACFLASFFRAEFFYFVTKSGDMDVYSDTIRGNVSLGCFHFFKYKFLCNSASYARALYFHSYGHRKQSVMLGPLYLPVIFIPSLVWDFLHSHLRVLWTKDYYSFYTEKWADRLGGVKR